MILNGFLNYAYLHYVEFRVKEEYVIAQRCSSKWFCCLLVNKTVRWMSECKSVASCLLTTDHTAGSVTLLSALISGRARPMKFIVTLI